MEDYYEYLDSNGVTTLYKLIKDDTVALIDSYSVTINGITTTLDTHINDSDIHTPISDIESMVDIKISGLVNSAPETLDTLKELSDALGNDPNFATTVANQIGNKANKDSVYTKLETNTLLEGKANSVHNHVVKDITDFPTIPTKLSQLENDMGFGTGGGSGDTSNCVHKTGDETIDGTKTFTNKLISNKELHYTDTKYDWTDTSLNTWCDAGHVAWFDKTGNRRMHELVGANGGVWRKACYINENQYFSVDSNRNISFWGNTTFNGNIYATNAHITYTYTNRVTTYSITHPTDDSYFFVSGGTNYDKGATLYLGGVSATNFTPGRFALAARKTDGSSVELAGSPDGSLTWGGKNIAIDENLVHTSGNETINGNKTFNNNVFVCGNLYDKNVQADLTQIPTSNIYTQYRFIDKNNKIMGYVQHVQRNTGVNQLTFIARDSNNTDYGFLVNTNKELLPGGNNTYSLGASGAKWANVYSTNDITDKVITYSVRNHNNTSSMTVCGGSAWDTGSTLFLYGNSHSNYPGAFNLAAKNTTNECKLIGFPNGSLTWGGKNVALDENLVHRTGNETISGTKTFTQGINIQNSDIDLTATPTSNKYSQNFFIDKNNKLLGVVQYAQRSTDVNDLDLYVYDKNSTAHGIQITTNNELLPIGNNYSLGSSSGHKWKNVYAATFNGNLKGNADSSTKSSYLDNYSLPGGNKIYLDWGVQKKGYVGLKVDNTTMGGLITTKNIGSILSSVNSARYATTQATTDNSNKIATTAWVRNYVDSVESSSEVGSSIAAYYSNATTLTAEGNSSSSGGSYPSDYSDYINISPTVGTIYTGSQLFGTLNASASGSKNSYTTSESTTYQTTAKATANFSGAFSPSAKYLCTTANAVRFRAYVSAGTTSDIGTASVVDNSSTKSIFTRIE